MTLQKPVRSSLVKQIAEQLVERIESGNWKVGERIPPEPELVEQLGISRNTLREAVQALIHTGMLEARQGDGTYVRAASEFGAAMQRRLKRSTLLEILEVRYGLEREIARLAASRRTEADLQTIRQKLDTSLSLRHDPQGYISADVAFHIAVARATHNSVMIDLYEQMTESLHMSVGGTVDVKELMDEQAQTHGALVQAIAEQNADAAEEAARSLIQASKTALLERIQKGSLDL
jgi:DNA-binding FadR family transcriptional regulator